VGRFHRGFGSLGDMSSFVGRFHRGFGSLGDMSSFVGRFIVVLDHLGI
jgi:hypothetical protein